MYVELNRIPINVKNKTLHYFSCARQKNILIMLGKFNLK